MFDYPEYEYCNVRYYYTEMRGKREYVTGVVFDYYKPMQKKKAALDRKIKKIVEEIPATCVTDYDKALYLHDYLCKNIKYNEDNKKWCYSAYGALLQGKCVCDGYSKAYNLLLNRAGIKAWKVDGHCYEEDGTLSDEGHAWNIMWIDEKCFYADVTWDDSPEDNIFYTYFCKSRETMDKARVVLYGNNNNESKYYNQFLRKAIPECHHDESEYLPPGTIKITGPLNYDLYKYIENSFGQAYPLYDDEDGINKFARKVDLYYDGNEDLKKWLESYDMSIGFVGETWYGIYECGNMYTYEIMGLNNPTATVRRLEPWLDLNSLS